MRGVFWLLAVLIVAMTPALADERPLVRFLTSDFVLPGKFRALEPLAAAEGVRIETGGEAPLRGADLVVLDVPRPSDRAQVEAALEGQAGDSPRLTVGGGRPDWQGLTEQDATRLAGWYAAGGAANYRQFFRYVAALARGAEREGFPDPVPLPETGIYHPDAPRIFASVAEYRDWRGIAARGTVGILISSGAVSGLQSGVEDALIRAIEAEGLLPVAFWAPVGQMPEGLDALVIRTHAQGGEAFAAALRGMDVPVIQTIGYRGGTPEAFRAAQSGVAQGTAAIFLAGAEVWGASDPLVLMAVEDGAEVVIPEQLAALTGKLRALVALRHKPAAEKRLALMFWNYPAGEKNLSASNLNVPRSIEEITTRLAQAGYGVTPLSETAAIEGAQALLAGIWRSTPPEDLLAKDLAVALPVADYTAWLATLPEDRRREMRASGTPERHWAVREVDGRPAFVIPRLSLGNLVILPQMPRDAHGGHYHDTASAPDHLYLAAYLWLRQGFGADALIHLGTHGTQEWLKGKDRGLWAGDYPYLAVGDVPVFYPYLQDNVAEAMQAKRRGRAVIISHQTPPFAPAGLHDDLRDLHHLIHEHAQLEPGPVQDKAARRIRAAVEASGIGADMGWDTARIDADFAGYLAELHDHLHFLAQSAVPLGLHSFGRAAEPEHRLVTVMQQLGAPFLSRFGMDAEPFSDDPARIGESAPVAMLRGWLRDGQGVGDPLRARAAELDAALAEPGEVEALLAGLAGRFVLPGAGGDPVRDPEIRAGRNLYAFEADRIPAESAYAAGGEALAQVIAAYAQGHDGAAPEKLAFSLWASEAISHLGVTEAQILHALGLRPVRDRAGRVTALDIIPMAELGRPRINVVVSVTSVYRDQFDGFMRLLDGAITRLAALDEPGNPVATNSRRIAKGLIGQGTAPDDAARLSRYRIFSNSPDTYGSGVSHVTLNSSGWEDEAVPAQTYLDGTRHAYGAGAWGEAPKGVNLFAEQLRGSDAAIMSRSSNLHGVLGSDHPFEFLGGLALAIRHLDGQSPDLFISDLRRGSPRTATLAAFLSDELRLRYLSPQWITAMQAEGYAGTLAVLDGTNNLFGWQVTAPESVRADQWQAMFDTYVKDSNDLGIDAWFEAHNPSAQAQIIARMAEAVRKGYWDAPEDTRRKMAERWQELNADPEVRAGEAKATREFLADLAAGYGIGAQAPVSAGETVPEQVSGQVLEPVPPPAGVPDHRALLGAGALLALVALGAGMQIRSNRIAGRKTE
ncbi:cobaltochelatase subunit CobN [Paenirhodobacter sp.]|uniref:cobaltochelatase subunit CobN n=1 Tax=Paenirhodobacter sp. TaxID=1965326 RepID=UPI003B3C56BC